MTVRICWRTGGIWNILARRPDVSDGLFPAFNVGLPMWENYPVFSAKPKKEEKVGLAEAISSSILSTGRIDLQRKLFCSIQLIGGVALTAGLIPAVEESGCSTVIEFRLGGVTFSDHPNSFTFSSASRWRKAHQLMILLRLVKISAIFLGSQSE
ncbi:hypothetical protein Tsubulata_050961 [Turnera subulata]|uniref:Uncharacterized protein n=1 Tax=Turnera subulata TaxID=218843 RepID=A0A9Q0F409_9ROSI|nr:hypothetical protein Tsubulata_050961 [Turnera subulata]